MSEQWRQERPSWCPYGTCGFLMRVQDSICCGRLPENLEHDGDLNTHRICFRGASDDGEWNFSLEVNRGDAFHLKRVCDKVMNGD